MKNSRKSALATLLSILVLVSIGAIVLDESVDAAAAQVAGADRQAGGGRDGGG